MLAVRSGLVLSAVWLLVACAGTRKSTVEPSEMSAAKHEEEARKEEKEAAWHKEQYRPPHRQPSPACMTPEGKRPEGPCWSSSANPTTIHLREAELHRKHAADHRAASKALREAEARACVGIADEDRDLSPLSHCDDIENVQPAVGRAGRLEGATVLFRPVPGMSVAWLQRIVDCHIARNAELGFEAHAGHAPCPLALKGVKAQVMQTWGGFTLTIRSDDPATAQQIVERTKGFLVCEGEDHEWVEDHSDLPAP